MSLESEINFGCKIIKCLNKSSSLEPIIFSPASILNGLAMILSGAKEKTASEIVNVIGKGNEFFPHIFFSNDDDKVKVPYFCY